MQESVEEHFEGKIAQKVIVVRDGKILLVKDPRGKEGFWEIPGGRMNIDEEPREAMRREFREEMGVDIEVGSVIYMSQFMQSNEGKRAFVIVYEARLKDDFDGFSVDEREVSEVGWFGEAEVQTLQLYPEYEEAVKNYFKRV